MCREWHTEKWDWRSTNKNLKLLIYAGMQMKEAS